MRNWKVLAFCQRIFKIFEILYKVCSDCGKQPIGDIFAGTVASLEKFIFFVRIKDHELSVFIFKSRFSEAPVFVSYFSSLKH